MPHGKYPVIDIGNCAGNYQRVYCSDYFSSMEIIPLEIKKECLLDPAPRSITLTDELIFLVGTEGIGFSQSCHLYVFNRSGKFITQIGNIGNGPGEYSAYGVSDIFLNLDKSTIFVTDNNKIFEYEFNGKFIRSFPVPSLENRTLSYISFVNDNLFIGSFSYRYNNGHKYCLFDRNGDIVKLFPAYYFIDEKPGVRNSRGSTFKPFRIDNTLYLKDYENDTLYTLAGMNIEPTYVFDFGKYSYPVGKANNDGQIELISVDGGYKRYMLMGQDIIVGTPKYLFYNIQVPEVLPRPKSRPDYFHGLGREIPNESSVRGIYDIKKNTAILLDTDVFQQKGIINDINGGLSFFPKCYVGNGVVADIWNAENMKEILTEEYFSTLKIKDKQAHQKLRELLKILKEEDNPVVVIAKLK